MRDGGFEIGEIDRAGRDPKHEDAEHEAEIADAVANECLVGGGGRGRRTNVR
jgi:hypothetical protein